MSAATDRLEVYEADDGWRWRRVAANNRVLCTGEAHTREADADQASMRACPDLDPTWVQPIRPADRTPLELLGQLLDATDAAARDEAMTKLQDWLP